MLNAQEYWLTDGYSEKTKSEKDIIKKQAYDKYVGMYPKVQGANGGEETDPMMSFKEFTAYEYKPKEEKAVGNDWKLTEKDRNALAFNPKNIASATFTFDDLGNQYNSNGARVYMSKDEKMAYEKRVAAMGGNAQKLAAQQLSKMEEIRLRALARPATEPAKPMKAKPKK